MPHTAEEDHLQQPEEQEQEEDGEADRAEWIEVMVSQTLRVAISMHWYDRSALLLERFCHFGSLRNSLCYACTIGGISARSEQTNKQRYCDQPNDDTFTKHVYLQ